MGYYTDFDLSEIDKKFYETIEDVSGYEIDVGYIYGAKWYNHDKDMLEVSVMFPDELFVLYGEGEESGDIWKTYYKNGKMQYCEAKIVYDDFDESNL